MKGVNSKNIAKVITDKVLTELKNDPGKWIKSWSDANRPVNLVTGREYTGCNWLWLAMMQGHEGNDSNEWCTYNQAKELTGLDYPIKKGSKGQPVILYKPQKIKKLVNGELKEQSFPIMRVYQVFNRSSIIDLPPKEIPEEEENKLERVEVFVNKHKINLKNGFDHACFIPKVDEIHMPNISNFKSTEDYYATLLHEMTHWTGHEKRLDRKLRNAYGNEAYAFEELIAELGAAMMCNHLNIEGKLQHTEYIASWLKVLENDEKAVLKASAQAQKAFDYLLGDSNGHRKSGNNSESVSVS